MMVDRALRIVNSVVSILASALAALEARWREAGAVPRPVRVEAVHPDLRLMLELRARARDSRRVR